MAGSVISQDYEGILKRFWIPGPKGEIFELTQDISFKLNAKENIKYDSKDHCYYLSAACEGYTSIMAALNAWLETHT